MYGGGGEYGSDYGASIDDHDWEHQQVSDEDAFKAHHHDMDYNYAQPGWNDHTYPSETPRYGVSAEDWNEAREELAHLGLSGSHDIPDDPLESYHDHITTTHHPSEPSLYDKDPRADLHFGADHGGDYSSGFNSNPASHHHLDSDDFLNYRDTLRSSPSENLTPGRWSSDRDSSLHPSSPYSPGRSRYDQELPSSHLDPPDFHHHYPDLGSPYLSTDPYKEGQELLDDPLLHQKNDHHTHHLRSSLHHHPNDEHGVSFDLGHEDDLYRNRPYDHLDQDAREFSSADPSNVRLDAGYSPRNKYSELPHELEASPKHDRSGYGPSLQQSYRNDDFSHSPHNSEFLDRPPLTRSPLLGDDLDASRVFHDPVYERNTTTNFDEFTGRSASPHHADYSSHGYEARLTPQSYSNDPLHFDSDPASRSRANGLHHFTDEFGGQMRSKVDRALHEPLNDLHHHHHSFNPSRTSGSSYAVQRDEIERMRDQLDRCTLENMTPELRPERSSVFSREPMPSLSGLRSPHSKSFQSPLMASMSTLGPHASVDPLPARSRTPVSVASGRRSPFSNFNRDSWPSSNVPLIPRTPPALSMDLPPVRSRTPLSVASGRRSPYSNLNRDSWPSSNISMIPRTPSVLALKSRHHHTSDPLDPHANALRNQLQEISHLSNEIRRSEQAHQQELAQISQVTSKLAEQSLNDEIRQADAAYQRELSSAHQQAALDQHALDRDLRRNSMAYQPDLALVGSRDLGLTQPSMFPSARENEIYRELNEQRRQLDLQRAELSRQHDRLESQSQLNLIDRQLRAIDRQREIDSNRQLANLTRFGHLPSVLKGNYGGRPLASPYLQQSRILSAMRRWSDRDKSRHKPPIVYDHIDAYYSLMSDHLPKHLPMFQDPYYSYDSHLRNPSAKTVLGLVPSTRLSRELRMGNPFVDGIDYDYGFGRVGPLGLKYEQFASEQAYILDDLYLYELLLRLDQSIDEMERQRRWRARLRWEEWKDNLSRVQAWKRMSIQERKCLGLNDGSYWASNLFGIPLDSRFGYTSSLSSHRYRPNDLRSHYTLTPSLLSRYPMWTRGGLGLGRRLSNWFDSMRRSTHHPNLDRYSRFHHGYSKRGSFSSKPNLISPTLLSGPHHSRRLSGSLGSANTLSQHLPPLAPLLHTSSLNKGLSRVPSSLSIGRRSDVGTYNLGSGSAIASASLKGSSNKTSATAPSKTTTKTTNDYVNSVQMPSKNYSGTHPIKSSETPTITKKPVPLKPGSSSWETRHSQPTHKSQPTSNEICSRPRTPKGTSKKDDPPINRSTTPTVVFNPRVTAVPPESESDPPPIPRPPSRTSVKAPPSVLKSTPSSQNLAVVSASHLNLNDDTNLDFITKLNTERNRTPAPPEDCNQNHSHLSKTSGVRGSN